MARRTLCLASLLCCVALLCSASPSLTYTVSMPHPATHLFDIAIRIDSLPAGVQSVDLLLPAWRSGRYVIFDFAGGVERFSAVDGKGDPLLWKKVDKETWNIATRSSGTVLVHYLLFADEPNLRTRDLSDLHGFIDAAAVFMYVKEYRDSPLTLIVRPFEGWHVTTSLDPLPGQPDRFTVANYDLLADSPLEIGTQRDYDFTVRGVPHVLSIAGRTNVNADSMIVWIKQIVEIDASYWGGLPYRRYVFLLRALPNGGGGTEHLNSCVLDVRESPLRTPDAGRASMGLFSHEFFHTWNVKRLRPKGMHPYDWTKENYYRELWLAEGGTSYLDNLLLVRGKLSPVKTYLWGIARQVESDRERPGNAEQSAAECSFDAWIKFNKPANDSYNFQTDFYERGAALSLLLDLDLRNRTKNRYSLDDLLRLMYKRFPPESPGYTLDDLENAAVELGGSGMTAFFKNYISGTGRLPWEEELDHAGLTLAPVKGSQHAWLGIAVGDDGGIATVQSVVEGSPAYDAGIDVGDQVLAIDDLRVHAEDFAARIADRSPGDSINVSFFHHSELRERRMVLVQNPVPTYTVARVEEPRPLQKRIFESWLGCPWERE